jgi:hypothetical protein
MKRKPKQKITGIAPRKPKMKEIKNPFIKDDAWDENFMVDLGIMQFLNDCSKLEYELRNCVRGAYVLEGGDPKDLMVYLNEMKESLEDVCNNVESAIGGD